MRDGEHDSGDNSSDPQAAIEYAANETLGERAFGLLGGKATDQSQW
jgi:hypothetical protein